MSKHTPGPWTIEPPAEEIRGRWIQTADKHRFIALALRQDGEEGSTREIANARLIAAAPDLLFAANRMLEIWSGGYSIDESNFKPLRAAVAKAEAQ